LVVILVVVYADLPNNNIGGGLFSLGNTQSEVYQYFNAEGPSTRLHGFSAGDYGQTFTVSSGITCYYNKTSPKLAVQNTNLGHLASLRGHALADSDGNRVYLDGKQFTMTMTSANSNNIPGTNLTWMCTFTVNGATVTFRLSAVIWSGTGLVNVDGYSFNVIPGDTKTTYYILGWPFKTTASRLVYSTFLNSDQTNQQLLGNTALSVGVKYVMGSTTYTVPLSSYVDGTFANINASLWVDGTIGNTIQALAAFAFQKGHTVLYDPLTTFATSGALATPINMLLIIVAGLIALVALY